METRIIKSKITLEEVAALAKKQYGDMVKAAVDVEQEIMGVGGELHIDIQSLLIEKENSRGENIWGINLYPEKTGDDFIEFDSMVNLKPPTNRTRDVGNPEIKNKIRSIVHNLIAKE